MIESEDSSSDLRVSTPIDESAQVEQPSPLKKVRFDTTPDDE